MVKTTKIIHGVLLMKVVFMLNDRVGINLTRLVGAGMPGNQWTAFLLQVLVSLQPVSTSTSLLGGMCLFTLHLAIVLHHHLHIVFSYMSMAISSASTLTTLGHRQV